MPLFFFEMLRLFSPAIYFATPDAPRRHVTMIFSSRRFFYAAAAVYNTRHPQPGMVVVYTGRTGSGKQYAIPAQCAPARHSFERADELFAALAFRHYAAAALSICF